MPMRSLFLKRLFDIVISSWGIILTLPLWFVISIMILLDDGCPIYYLQSRVGKNGRILA
jgi:lipopolysaccharide/colanic/teichoic acid biosynthesis glycosyltransferase